LETTLEPANTKTTIRDIIIRANPGGVAMPECGRCSDGPVICAVHNDVLYIRERIDELVVIAEQNRAGIKFNNLQLKALWALVGGVCVYAVKQFFGGVL
jgi:hypothetical protein